MSKKPQPIRVNWKHIQSVSRLLSSEQFTLLAKYRARRDYAVGFTPSRIDGMSIGTSDAYFVMLKLGLAYTAAELLARVTNQKHNLGIKSVQFSQALNSGKFDKLLAGIDADNARRYPNGSSNLLEKWKNTNAKTDLSRLVSQFRNYMFHGAFSPSESGLARSKTLRNLVLELADQIIESSEDALQKWLVSLNNKKKVG